MPGQEHKNYEELTAAAVVAGELIETNPTDSVIGLKIGPFNAALYRRREELGLTQKELAKLIGYKTSASIGQLETLRAFPKPEVAGKIALALGLDVNQLFPQWLKMYTRDRKEPAQIRVQLTNEEIDRLKGAAYLEALIAPDPHEHAERADLGRLMVDLLDSLTPREKRALQLSYAGGLTYDEIAQEFGVDKSRIGQIETKALRKLRHPSRTRQITDFVDRRRRDIIPVETRINGVINALHQGDHHRALTNLKEIENTLYGELHDQEKDLVNTVALYEGFNQLDMETIDKFIDESLIDGTLSWAYMNSDRRYHIEGIIRKLQEISKLRAQILNQ